MGRAKFLFTTTGQRLIMSITDSVPILLLLEIYHHGGKCQSRELRVGSGGWNGAGGGAGNTKGGKEGWREDVLFLFPQRVLLYTISGRMESDHEWIEMRDNPNGIKCCS